MSTTSAPLDVANASLFENSFSKSVTQLQNNSSTGSSSAILGACVLLTICLLIVEHGYTSRSTADLPDLNNFQADTSLTDGVTISPSMLQEPLDISSIHREIDALIANQALSKHIQRQGPVFFINSELLFSEGETTLSRSGQAALENIFSDIPPDLRLSISITPRTDIKSEFVFGMSDVSFKTQRVEAVALQMQRITKKPDVNVHFGRL